MKISVRMRIAAASVLTSLFVVNAFALEAAASPGRPLNQATILATTSAQVGAGQQDIVKANVSSETPHSVKPAWEWTLAERLAARLDPARITERELEDETLKGALRTLAKAAPRERVDSYSIDGRRHPELLLLHELFDGLMTGFVPNEDRQARQRKNFAPAIVSAGFDEHLFWAQLYSAASAYVSYKYDETGRSVDPAANRDRDHACRLAFDSLTAARQLFGQERFDRLLYQGIAPLTQVASATTAADPAAELQRVAAGCR